MKFFNLKCDFCKRDIVLGEQVQKFVPSHKHSPGCFSPYTEILECTAPVESGIVHTFKCKTELIKLVGESVVV